MDTELEKLEKAPQQIETGRLRRVGVSKFLIAFGALLLLWLYLKGTGSTISDLNSGILAGAASIAAYGLAGATEIVSGMPITTLVAVLEARWASLRWWQRGILGMLIAIFTFLFFAFVVIWVPI